jgi:hypothetical protein
MTGHRVTTGNEFTACTDALIFATSQIFSPHCQAVPSANDNELPVCGECGEKRAVEHNGCYRCTGLKISPFKDTRRYTIDPASWKAGVYAS